MDKREIAVGVIGTGDMGGRHARNIHAAVFGARLAGLFDADAGRAKAVADDCGGARVFDDAQALICDRGVDALVIATPDPFHASLTLECLRQGKPVLCEKPLATSAADARAVVDEEIKLNRRLVQVGFMRHYDPHHVAVKQTIRSGAIGRPILFKGSHRNAESNPYNTGDGVILSSAIHDLDSCRWFLEQEIEEVAVRAATSDPSLGAGHEDLVAIQLVLSGGCLGVIEVFVNARYGYEVSVEVVGDQGTAHTPPSEGAIVRREGTCAQPVHPGWLERFGPAYRIELQQWVQSLQEGGPAGPSAWDGYASLLASDACIASMRSGRPETVPVPKRPALYDSR